MPKKIDKEKEENFIKLFCESEISGNATKCAERLGYKANSRQMGAYLKNKLSSEIRDYSEQRIANTSGLAINVLQDLLINSEQDSVKMNVAKLILELGNYSQSTINLNVDSTTNKTDEELVTELKALIVDMPHLSPKLEIIKTLDSKEDNNLLPSKEKSKDLVKH